MSQSKPKLPVRVMATTTLVVIAVIVSYMLYQRYVRYPWTRDGQITADVILLTPRVSGWVTKLNVVDNQQVKADDLPFEIDPRPFEIQLDSATVQLDESREQVAALEAAVNVAQAAVQSAEAGITSAKARIEDARAQIESAESGIAAAKAGVQAARADIDKAEATLQQRIRDRDRAKKLAADGAGSVAKAESTQAAVEASTAAVTTSKAGLLSAQAQEAQADAGLAQAQANLVVSESGLGDAEADLASAIASLEQARANLGVPGEENTRIRGAKANLAQAELDLEWTSVRAPTDGYVTNLVVKLGDYASAGTAMLAFVDQDSFYALGYFQETELNNLKTGDPVEVTLMAHRDQPIKGEVESIGLAINPPDIAQTGRDGDSGIVPQVQPSFDWIRLAQRVPVRIKLTEIPADLQLIAGTTCSVAAVSRD
ncbi:MAG: efflux RND transporter periplasmic adaptor subunit [Planctomycetota bacterium]|jgi:multidrug resistance efflux pump